MTVTELNKEIKTSSLTGAYIFFGNEDYLKNHYIKTVRKTVLGSEDTNDINYIRFDSENFSLSALSSAIETLPCFAEKKMIEIYECDLISMNEGDTEDLKGILGSLDFHDHNVLVFFTRPFEFDPGTYKKGALIPSKQMASLSEVAKCVAFEYESESKLVSWIKRHFDADGLSVNDADSRMLIDYCGRDMYCLSSEIAKLSAYLKAEERTELCSKDIELICIRNREYGAFAFSNAILEGNVDTAYAVLAKLREQREKPEYILSAISNTFANLCLVKALAENGATKQDVAQKLKIHEYSAGLYLNTVKNKSPKKLRKLFDRCFEADVKLKNSPLDTDEVLDRLVISTVGL
ncbi:MAG: DNA polymerase III subunit delta [Ruminococcaceae bacterium]|nr:DNA polymerase III subunit delta [Oscillospiraceae bacterium]